jgi:hypothetical protein
MGFNSGFKGLKKWDGKAWIDFVLLRVWRRDDLSSKK